MKGSNIRGSLLLLITALIWGTAFVFQFAGMDSNGPFTFNAARMLLGAVALMPVILIKNRKQRLAGLDRRSLRAGAVCGLLLFAGSSLQQLGMYYSAGDKAVAGRSGFITALYIIIVPILGVVTRRRPRANVWCAAILAAVGMYLLCFSGGLGFTLADGLLLGCSLSFAVHIIVLDRVSSSADGVVLSCTQFAVTGVLSLVVAFIFERPSIGGLVDAWSAILFTGLLSSGVGYTLQVIGQRDTDPTVASIIMSLESVFAVLAGVALLGERMSGREIAGCIVMFAAIILAQLPITAFGNRS